MRLSMRPSGGDICNWQNQELQNMIQHARQTYPIEPQKPFDPINLFPSVVEFFLPIGSGEEITLLGFWIDSNGLLKITIQQCIIPNNIYTQIKIITLRLPSALLLTIFFFGFGMFSIKLNTLGRRAAEEEVIQQSLND